MEETIKENDEFYELRQNKTIKRIKINQAEEPEIELTIEDVTNVAKDGKKIETKDRYREKFFLMLNQNNPLKQITRERRETKNENQSKNSDKEFFDLYDIGDVIGEGTTAVVRKIKKKGKCKFYAIKSYKQKCANFWPSAKYETDILNRLNHKFIIKSVKFFKSTTVRKINNF